MCPKRKRRTFFLHFSLKNDIRFGFVPWKISDFVSFPFFGFALVIKLRNIDVESHWNTLIFFDQKNIWRQIWLCPVEKNFSDKTEQVRFGKPLKCFNIFWLKMIWRQIWICPREKCLILFHFHCLFTLVLKLRNFDFESH